MIRLPVRPYITGRLLTVRPSLPRYPVSPAACTDFVYGTGESNRRATTVSLLPEIVLLEIFDFCRLNHTFYFLRVWKWHLLVHVCRRWRQLIFESPHRLNIQILCTHKTPVRKNLCIWPTLPIVVDCTYFGRGISPEGEDDVIAALEHPDRVCYIRLKVTRSELENMVAPMQVPFPVLTRLEIFSMSDDAPALSPGFLGGSAPLLEEITLGEIPFPALPTLLLSTNHLVVLTLCEIPPTGYISPEAMVVGLAALTKLEFFTIKFQSADPLPDQIRLPPDTRTVLPALTSFTFQGACEYLEDLVGRIDSPRLDRIHINCLDRLFDAPVIQLAKFLDRSIGPKLTLLKHARVCFFNDYYFSFAIYHQTNHPSSDWQPAQAIISCEGIDRQFSNITQSFHQLSAPLSNVVHLKLDVEPVGSRQIEGADGVEWLRLLRQFPVVQLLYVSQELAGHVALALEDIAGDMAAEVLPSIDLICLEGQPASSVGKFVAARQLSGRPVTVVDTKTEFNSRLESSVGK